MISYYWEIIAPTQKGAIFLQKCYKLESHDLLKVKDTPFARKT